MAAPPIVTVRTAPVPPPGAGPTLWIGGRDLRYVLTVLVHREGPLTVARMVALLDEEGFLVAGRPSKQVSDALRWEIGRRRVERLARGRYGPGVMPPTTRRRIARHVDHLRTLRR